MGGTMKKIWKMMYHLCACVKKRHFEIEEPEVEEPNGCCANIGAESTINGGEQKENIWKMMYLLGAFIRRQFVKEEPNSCCENIGAEGTIDTEKKKRKIPQ